MAAVSAFCGFVTIFLVDDCQPVGIIPNFTEVNQVRYAFEHNLLLGMAWNQSKVLASNEPSFQMWCKKGEYSAVASLFFSNPEDSVKSLFHSPISGFCRLLTEN